MGEVSNAWSEPRPNIIFLEGNGYRPSHFGDGYRVSETMYTLNSTEVHAVCYEKDNTIRTPSKRFQNKGKGR